MRVASVGCFLAHGGGFLGISSRQFALSMEFSFSASYYFSFLTPFIMRIRFRASDFGPVAKIKLSRAKSKQASCAEIMLGSFLFLLE